MECVSICVAHVFLRKFGSSPSVRVMPADEAKHAIRFQPLNFGSPWVVP